MQFRHTVKRNCGQVQASFEYNRVRVREAKLCHGKDSVTVALGIELGVVDDDLGDMYRLIVQVKLKFSDLEMRL